MKSRNYLELRIIEFGSGEVLFKSRAPLNDEEEIRRLLHNVQLRDAMIELSEAEKNRKTLFGE